MTIQALLELLKTLQECDRGSAYEDNVLVEVRRVDIPALRLQCQQHAEHLRKGWRYQTDAGRKATRAAADFLAAHGPSQEKERT